MKGTTLSLVAKWFHVAIPEKAKQKTPPDVELADTIKAELTEIELEEPYHSFGKEIVDLGFPRSAIIAVTKRRGKFITTNVATVLEAKDILLILAESAESLNLVKKCIMNEDAVEDE